MSYSTTGWNINLTGNAIPVYGINSTNLGSHGSQIGRITPNECFAGGEVINGGGWEGWGAPVCFKNASGSFVRGVVDESSIANDNQIGTFTQYASNGSSWLRTSSLKRYVQYATVAYYADGSKFRDLPAGSYVWLTSRGTKGATYEHYIAVTAVQPKGGSKLSFSGNGFIDLTYGGHWLNVGSILLRQA